jgi:hypothetical protein
MNEGERNSFRLVAREFYDTQRERLRLDGLLGQKKDGSSKKGVPERDPAMLMIVEERQKQIAAYEGELFKELVRQVHKMPLWKEFLSKVKGCGETMAAVIISEFDIEKAPTVSNLWSFAGLAPGKDRRVKGEKSPFNGFLRSKLCGVLGPSFLKCKSPYSNYYYGMKMRLESKGWGMPSKNPTDPDRPCAGHQHKAANRYMVKMFLKDLYIAWRTMEGLLVRPPYQEEYLGKRHSA